MAYQDDGLTIDATGDIVTGNTNTTGLITKAYLFDAYPQLLDQAKSAGFWVWGYYPYAGGTSRSSPVQTTPAGLNWKTTAFSGSSAQSSGGIKSDGSLWTWGTNTHGQLGNNSVGSVYTPAQTVAAGTNWSSFSVGYGHMAAIKTDGTLWLWGWNKYGALGDNTTVDKSSPVQTVAGGSTWKLVACAFYNTAAIKTDGTLWTWGTNTYGGSGIIGDNTVTRRSSPVQTVAGGTNWKLLDCGSYNVAAIKTDGTLWTWGNNTYGQIGDNTVTPKSSPVQTVAGGTNWKQISLGNSHSVAIKTDGTLWLWGYNTYGQLGDGTITHRSSPIQTVAGGTNWKQASSTNHTTAIKTDGTLWTWGRNAFGQLGDNTQVSKSSPVQTVAGGTNWKKVAATGEATSAIKDFSEDL